MYVALIMGIARHRLLKYKYSIFMMFSRQEHIDILRRARESVTGPSLIWPSGGMH